MNLCGYEVSCQPELTTGDDQSSLFTKVLTELLNCKVGKNHVFFKKIKKVRILIDFFYLNNYDSILKQFEYDMILNSRRAKRRNSYFVLSMRESLLFLFMLVTLFAVANCVTDMKSVMVVVNL